MGCKTSRCSLACSRAAPQSGRSLVLNRFLRAYHINILYIALCAVPAVLLGGCSGSAIKRDPRPNLETIQEGPERQVYDRKSEDAPAAYREAVLNLRSRHLDEALAGFQKFLVESPSSKWTLAAQVNEGLALQALERWSEAIAQYRIAVVSSQGVASALQITALYGLVGCYEALGDDQATIAVLRDLLETSRRASLPAEFAQAELPGRLAAAYARSGNVESALIYYKKAELGINRLRARPQNEQPKWLGETLYLVGRVALQNINWLNFDTVLRVLNRSQIFLVQAAELGQSPWSEKAAQELIRVYRDLWTVIENPPASSLADPLLAQREVQEKKWVVAGMLLDELQLLRAYELPAPERTSPEADKVFAFANELQNKINALLVEQPAGEGLTPESIQRQEAVKGRVMLPDSTLEGQYLRSHEEKPNLPATSIPENNPDQSLSQPSTQDPNL
jgi:tetratricopeptide (TPR) repeat protein